MTTKTESLKSASDALFDEFNTINEALYKTVGETEEAHRGQDYYVGVHASSVDAARLPEVGEVIEYYVGDSRTYNNRRVAAITKITEKSILGNHFGGTDLTEYDSVTYRLSRTNNQWYRTYLTVEERAELTPLRDARDKALNAFNDAYSEYHQSYMADQEAEALSLKDAREKARNGFDSYEYYDAYPEISIKIDGRSGGYLVEISDWSLEDEDETRTLTVPRDVLVQLVAKIIDTTIEQGEEEK